MHSMPGLPPRKSLKLTPVSSWPTCTPPSRSIALLTVLALAADENLKQQIINGLRRRLPDVDCRAIREAGLSGKSDPEVLAWAAKEDRIVVEAAHHPLEFQNHRQRHEDGRRIKHYAASAR